MGTLGAITPDTITFAADITVIDPEGLKFKTNSLMLTGSNYHVDYNKRLTMPDMGGKPMHLTGEIEFWFDEIHPEESYQHKWRAVFVQGFMVGVEYIS